MSNPRDNSNLVDVQKAINKSFDRVFKGLMVGVMGQHSETALRAIDAVEDTSTGGLTGLCVYLINPDDIVGGGGTEYTEGDTDATITGTALMWEDSADTLRAVSAVKPLPIEIVTSINLGVTQQTDPWSVDVDLGGSSDVTLADNRSTATAIGTASHLMAYDGANWDRARAVAGQLISRTYSGDGTVITETAGALDVNIASGSSSGTEYTEGDVDATITGIAAMWEDTGDTLRAVSAAKPLPVDISAVVGPAVDAWCHSGTGVEIDSLGWDAATTAFASQIGLDTNAFVRAINGDLQTHTIPIMGRAGNDLTFATQSDEFGLETVARLYGEASGGGSWDRLFHTANALHVANRASDGTALDFDGTDQTSKAGSGTLDAFYNHAFCWGNNVGTSNWDAISTVQSNDGEGTPASEFGLGVGQIHRYQEVPYANNFDGVYDGTGGEPSGIGDTVNIINATWVDFCYQLKSTGTPTRIKFVVDFQPTGESTEWYGADDGFLARFEHEDQEVSGAFFNFRVSFRVHSAKMRIRVDVTGQSAGNSFELDNSWIVAKG